MRTAGWAGRARVAGRRPAGDGGRPQNRAPHTGSGCGLAADGGVLNITAAVWTAGFHWWHSGNKKRTQNVIEYMLILAVCLVLSVIIFPEVAQNSLSFPGSENSPSIPSFQVYGHPVKC